MVEDDVPRVSIDAIPNAVVAGRYRVRREIARGGMGAVLEVDHVHLGRRLALKLAFGSASEMPLLSARLEREARATELSRGLGVVDIVDAGILEGEPYIALEMLDGRALDGLLAARRKLPLEHAVQIIVELCDALDHVHRAGVVHRDIKPSNVFIAQQRGGGERVVLIDFGIAQLPVQSDLGKLTKIGERLGTPDYMSPEQLLAEPIDHRADLFGVGVVLFEALAGELPVAGGGAALLEVLFAGRPIPSLAQRAGTPAALDAFVARVLARDKNQRPATARALADELVALTGIARAPLAVLEPSTSSKSSQTSKRQHARVPYVAPLRVVDTSGVTYDGQVADLSERGVLAMLRAPIASGVRVTLRFGLPVSGRVGTFEAVARWGHSAHERHAVGFELVSPSPDAVQEIARYVAFASGSRA